MNETFFGVYLLTLVTISSNDRNDLLLSKLGHSSSRFLITNSKYFPVIYPQLTDFT